MIELGCTACREAISLETEFLRPGPKDNVNNYVLLIVRHYRLRHSEIMDTFMYDYTRYLFAKVGLVLP